MNETLIENRANALLKKNKISKWPVNLHKIIKHEKIELIEKDLEDNEAGFLFSKPQMAIIAVNKNHHGNRKRFTIGHELGHYVLHCDEKKEKVFVDKKRIYRRNEKSKLGTDQFEIDANYFAACLLMPTDLVEKYLSDFSLDEFCEDMICEMAEEFQVSTQALSIRLEKLGYDIGF